MSKQSLLMSEIVKNYHPAFIKSKQRRKDAVNKPKLYNAEFLVEEALASIGPYTRTDGWLADFSDLSDSKTSSIMIEPSSVNVFRGQIRGVSTIYGNTKAGALRCIIYNPHKEKLLYYFLPKSVWVPMISRTRLEAGRICFTYNRQFNFIPRFVGYECDSFEELALAMDV